MDFYAIKSKRRIIALEQLKRSGQEIAVHEMQLSNVIHSTIAPINVQEDIRLL